jgi:hypothetical protein
MIQVKPKNLLGNPSLVVLLIRNRDEWRRQERRRILPPTPEKRSLER